MAMSPFRRATQSDIRMLRGIARLMLQWEMTVAAESTYNFPPVARVRALNDGDMLSRLRAFESFEARALRRLERKPNWSQIRESRRIAYMKRFDQRAYEVHQLRAELAEVRVEVSALSNGTVS